MYISYQHSYATSTSSLIEIDVSLVYKRMYTLLGERGVNSKVLLSVALEINKIIYQLLRDDFMGHWQQKIEFHKLYVLIRALLLITDDNTFFQLWLCSFFSFFFSFFLFFSFLTSFFMSFFKQLSPLFFFPSLIYFSPPNTILFHHQLFAPFVSHPKATHVHKLYCKQLLHLIPLLLGREWHR